MIPAALRPYRLGGPHDRSFLLCNIY
jgi:hypothetical protein